MNTIAFISAGVILVLVILAKLPGLEHTVRPMIDLVFTGIKAILENGVSWSIWAFKVLLGAHLEVFKHLLLSAESIDPSHSIRAKEEAG